MDKVAALRQIAIERIIVENDAAHAKRLATKKAAYEREVDRMDTEHARWVARIRANKIPIWSVEMYAMHLEGVSAADIAERFHCSAATVRKRIKAAEADLAALAEPG